MHWHKFQAMVTTGSGAEDMLAEVQPGQMRRMLVHGEHQENHNRKFFSALVTNNGGGSLSAADGPAMLTVALAGDDVAEYFDIGSSFSLWLGGDVGRGIVTRRLFL